MSSTREIKRRFDLCRQYDVFEPWLFECGFSWEDLPLTAKTETGEDVIVDAFSQDDKIVWQISTLQGNGWIRVNLYYEDGTVEELYER
jgi:hypothetical protein